MRFGTHNVGYLYRAGSVKTASRQLAKYNLGLMAVHKVRLDKGGSQQADDYTFSMETRMLIITLRTGLFIHKGIIPVKSLEFN
jgi:hypothetical protein